MICKGYDTENYVKHYPEPTRSAMRKYYQPHDPVKMVNEGKEATVVIFRCPRCGKVTGS